MAVKTFYLTDAAATGAGGALQDGGTAPALATTTTGWTVAKTAAGNYARMSFGSEVASGTFSTTPTPPGSPNASDAFRSTSPLFGDFAAGNWDFAAVVRAVSNGGAQDGRFRIRLYKTTAPDGSGSGFVELAGSATTYTCSAVTNLATSADQTSSNATINLPALSFDGEYLWVQVSWEITGAGGNNAADVLIRVGSDSRLVTPNFTATAPTVVTRYVDCASPTGGNGTTTSTAGGDANRAYASLDEALEAMNATDWPSLNQLPKIVCGGSTADTTPAEMASGWNGKLDAEHYLEVVTNQPSALATSTSHYRFEVTDVAAVTVTSTAAAFVRFTGIHALVTLATALANFRAINTLGLSASSGDLRFNACRVELVSVTGTYTGGAEAFVTVWTGAGTSIVFDNCVVVNWAGPAGTTFIAFRQNTSGTAAPCYFRNCDVYGATRGYQSGNAVTPVVAKNCGAVGCTDGFNGTFDASSTNNASDIAGDAPGSNPQSGVTPTFVNAPSDLHLASGDTAWRNLGADLSSDTPFALTTDGDGETRTGTWDIGADEVLGTTVTATKAPAAAAAPAATLGMGALSITATVGPASAAAYAATLPVPRVSYAALPFIRTAGVMGEGLGLPLFLRNPFNNTGAWDKTGDGPACGIRLGPGNFFMLFEGFTFQSGSGINAIGQATATKGWDWTRYGSNPIITANAAPNWEKDEVAPDELIWDPVANHWKLYYHGGNNVGPRQIGLMTSPDLSPGSWTRANGGNPVLPNGGTGAWDERRVADAMVFRLSATDWRMLYCGERASDNRVEVGYATSSDGVSWTKHGANPIFPAGTGNDAKHIYSPGGYVDPDGRVHMWYGGMDTSDVERVLYAYSDDWLTWTRNQADVIDAPSAVSTDPDVVIGNVIDMWQDDGGILWFSQNNRNDSAYPDGVGALNGRGLYWLPKRSLAPALPARAYTRVGDRSTINNAAAISAATVFTVWTDFKCPPYDDYRHLYTEGSDWNHYVALRLTDTGRLQGIFRTPSGAEVSVLSPSSPRYDDSTWHRAMWVRKAAADWELWVDGTLVASNTTDDGGTTGVSSFPCLGDWNPSALPGAQEPAMGLMRETMTILGTALTGTQEATWWASRTLPGGVTPTVWVEHGSGGAGADAAQGSATYGATPVDSSLVDLTPPESFVADELAATGAAASAASAAATLSVGSLSLQAVVAGAGAVAPVATLSVGSLTTTAVLGQAAAAGSAAATLTLGALSLTSTRAPAASVGPSATLAPGALTLTASPSAASAAGISATVTGATSLTATVALASAVAPVATLSSTLTLTATLGTAAAASASATLSATLTLTSIRGQATAAGFSATLSNALLMNATVAPAAASGKTAALATGAITVLAVRGGATGVAAAGALNVGALVVTGATGLSNAVGLAGSLSGVLSLTAVAGTASAVGLTATLTGTLSLTATLATASGVAYPATLASLTSLTATVAAAVAAGYAGTLEFGGLPPVTLVGTRAVVRAYGQPAILTTVLGYMKMTACAGLRPALTADVDFSGRLTATVTYEPRLTADVTLATPDPDCHEC